MADGGTIGATRYTFGANQGLSLAYSALASTRLYSIETVFEFDQFSLWRKIIDFNNRTTDDGFYFDPSNLLDFFPVVAGTMPDECGGLLRTFFAARRSTGPRG